MEETNKTLEADLLDSKKHGELLRDDLAHKEEQLTRANFEITSHKDDIKSKTEEVRILSSPMIMSSGWLHVSMFRPFMRYFLQIWHPL